MKMNNACELVLGLKLFGNNRERTRLGEHACILDPIHTRAQFHFKTQLLRESERLAALRLVFILLLGIMHCIVTIEMPSARRSDLPEWQIMDMAESFLS